MGSIRMGGSNVKAGRPGERRGPMSRLPITGVAGAFWDTVREPCSLCQQYHPFGWQDRLSRRLPR